MPATSGGSVTGGGEQMIGQAGEGDHTQRPRPAVLAAANAVVEELLAGRASRESVAERVRGAAERSGLDADAAARLVYALVAHDPRFLEIEPQAALLAQLDGLVLFSPAGHASL